MIKIDLIDFVANALIESATNYGVNEITQEQLNCYMEKIFMVLKENNEEARCTYYEAKTFENMMKENQNFIELWKTKEGNIFHINENSSIDDLWKKYRGYLSCSIMNVFMNSEVINSLNVEKIKQQKRIK